MNKKKITSFFRISDYFPTLDYDDTSTPATKSLASMILALFAAFLLGVNYHFLVLGKHSSSFTQTDAEIVETYYGVGDAGLDYGAKFKIEDKDGETCIGSAKISEELYETITKGDTVAALVDGNKCYLTEDIRFSLPRQLFMWSVIAFCFGVMIYNHRHI